MTLLDTCCLSSDRRERNEFGDYPSEEAILEAFADTGALVRVHPVRPRLPGAARPYDHPPIGLMVGAQIHSGGWSGSLFPDQSAAMGTRSRGQRPANPERSTERRALASDDRVSESASTAKATSQIVCG